MTSQHSKCMAASSQILKPKFIFWPEVFHNCFKKIFTFRGVAEYIDDILLWSDTIEEHNQRPGKVLETARMNKIKLNRAKYKIAYREIKYMGQLI